MGGLPGLPGAHQDGGRPASIKIPGRFAPLDGQTGRGATQVRPEPTHLCGVCMPEGRDTEMYAFSAYDLERDARLLGV